MEASLFQYHVLGHRAEEAMEFAANMMKVSFDQLQERVTADQPQRALFEQSTADISAQRNQTAAIAFESATEGTDSLAKLSRYEAALERSLFRALHELERLQARRKSREVHARPVVDVEVSVAPR